ncbi:MAG: NADH-quinone oxidoreductase subunit H, partial [Actinomadura rubrobrunea]|nr:NADH-quinone oxidoreductase subunit H [Actinomadura rubrobrunea]
QGWWPVLWFLVKVWAFIFFFIWLRGTLPRVRYDQLMKLGWKVLMPFSLGWILLVATIQAFKNEGYEVRQIMLIVAIVAAVVLAATVLWEMVRGEPAEEAAEAASGARDRVKGGAPADAAGGFPVPPLDAPHYHGKTGKPTPSRTSSKEVARGTH